MKKRPYAWQGECTVEDCDRKARSSGMCGMHYMRWERHGDPAIVLKHRNPTTTQECYLCNRRHHAKGFCARHHWYYVDKRRQA